MTSTSGSACASHSCDVDVDTARLYTEKQIGDAIRETSKFKELSGEPWRAAQDEASFHTAARHFAAVAGTLPDRRLDGLGRALSFWNLQRAGRTLAKSHELAAHELRMALAQTADGTDKSALECAPSFYIEIAQFQSSAKQSLHAACPCGASNHKSLFASSYRCTASGLFRL